MSSRTETLGQKHNGNTHNGHPSNNSSSNAHPDAAAPSGGHVPADTSFELLFSNNPHPMYVSDRETMRILEVNAADFTAVVQPGGSTRDDEVIRAADAHGVAMVFTGVRHFRH